MSPTDALSDGASLPAPSVKTRDNTLRDMVLVLLLGVICFSVHLWRGFTVDEYATWSRTRLPVADLIQDRLKNGHFPSYFLLVQAWSRLAGDAEYVLRAPSVVLGLAGLAALWLLVRDLAGRRAAMIAGALYPVHQVVIWSAQNARPWAGVLAFSILVALGLVRFWLTEQRRWLVVLAAAVMLGFSFAAAFALTIAAFVVALLMCIRCAPRMAGLSLTALLAPLAVMSVPALALAQTQEKYAGDRGPFRFYFFRGINGLADVILGDYKIWTGEWMRYVALVTVIWLGWMAFRSLSERFGGTKQVFLRHLVFCWLLVPWVCLMLGAAITRTSMLSNERYFVPLLGAVIIVLAVGLDRVLGDAPARPTRWLAVVGVWILLAATAAAYWKTNGDGPRLMVKEWLRGEPPRCVVGHVGPLVYEFRSLPAPRLVATYRHGMDEVRELLSREAAGGPVWLFVYNNKTDRLDPLLKQPVEGLRRVKTIRCRDARAALFEPADLALE